MNTRASSFRTIQLGKSLLTTQNGQLSIDGAPLVGLTLTDNALAGGTALTVGVSHHDTFSGNRDLTFSNITPTAGSSITLFATVTSPTVLTFPLSYRIGYTGSITSLSFAVGNHEISWTFADGKWWLADTSIDTTLIPYSQLQAVSASNRILGRSSAGAGPIEELTLGAGLLLTGTTLSTVNVVFGASGTSHSSGYVPDPGSTAGSAKFLREDSTWATPPALSVFGASGMSHSSGSVPDPGSTAGTVKFLREDSTWATPPSLSVTTNNIIYVDPVAGTSSGVRGAIQQPYQTLTQAIAVAQSGDTILLSAGTHNLATPISTTISNLAIKGKGMGLTNIVNTNPALAADMIYLTGSYNQVSDISFDGAYSIISSPTVRSSAVALDGGHNNILRVRASNFYGAGTNEAFVIRIGQGIGGSIKDCIVDNFTGYGSLIMLWGISGAEVSGNLVYNPSVAYSINGLGFADATSNCHIHHNKVFGGLDGLHFDTGSVNNMTIESNEFIGTSQAAIFFYITGACSNVRVINNTSIPATHNGWAYFLFGGPGAGTGFEISGNKVYKPTNSGESAFQATDLTNSIIRNNILSNGLRTFSQYNNTNCIFIDNTYEDGTPWVETVGGFLPGNIVSKSLAAKSNKIFVDPVNGSSAGVRGTVQSYQTLAQAVAVAQAGDIIELSSGTHNLPAVISQNISNLTIRGQGIGKTIILNTNATLGSTSFTAGGPYSQPMIFLLGDDNEISDLTMDGNRSITPLGYTADAIITNGNRCAVRRVRATNFRGGSLANSFGVPGAAEAFTILVDLGNDNVIEDCLADNIVGYGCCINAWRGEGCKLVNNHVEIDAVLTTDRPTGYSMYAGGICSNNTSNHTGIGINMDSGQGWGGATISNNRFENCHSSAIRSWSQNVTDSNIISAVTNQKIQDNFLSLITSDDGWPVLLADNTTNLDVSRNTLVYLGTTIITGLQVAWSKHVTVYDNIQSSNLRSNCGFNFNASFRDNLQDDGTPMIQSDGSYIDNNIITKTLALSNNRIRSNFKTTLEANENWRIFKNLTFEKNSRIIFGLNSKLTLV